MPTDLFITQESFHLLLGWLDADRESAGQKYERIRQRLIRVFIGRGCYEAEALADRTIDRVIAKLPDIQSNYVGDPAAYFYGVAHNIHHEWLRSQKRERETVFIDFTSDGDDGREYSCLETCLDKLPSDSREMIIEYYRDEKRAKIERRKSLARNLGISITALQIKACRIRAKLASCVSDCVAGSDLKGLQPNRH
jgi:DNA-directed RNA polymerase specialized sigma24 family protein